MERNPLDDIIIIGTSHISSDSAREVRSKILEEKPDFVALELDKDRIVSVLKNVESKLNWRMIPKFGIKGFIFLLIAKLSEEKLGSLVGNKPGVEMKSAYKAAKEVNSRVLLIDRHINQTLQRISKEFKFRRILWDLIKGIFSKKVRMKLQFDISKVPKDELIEKLLLITKKQYPGLYKVLITERNEIMSTRLFRIKIKNPESKIVAVVGAGHKKGMIEILKKKFEKNPIY